jgi:hypothetical protein
MQSAPALVGTPKLMMVGWLVVPGSIITIVTFTDNGGIRIEEYCLNLNYMIYQAILFVISVYIIIMLM